MVARDQGQIGFKLGTKHVNIQSLKILCKKNVSMLTSLKVSPLACKSRFLLVYYFAYCFELDFEGLET